VFQKVPGEDPDPLKELLEEKEAVKDLIGA
jgi:hypothetical protein